MTRPRRVLMTADAVGGVWTYALDLAAGLTEMGFGTTLAVLGPGPDAAARRAAAAVEGLTLVETGLPLDWTAREPREIAEAADALRELAHSVRPDLVQLNSPAFAADGGFPAPVVGVCHSCVATWWAAVKDGPLPGDFRWRTQALWRGLVACDALIAPSAAFAQATAQSYEIPPPFVVPNGRCEDDGPKGPCRNMVFASGRLWDEGKNVGVLDAAAALIAAPVCAAGPLAGPNGAAVEVRNLRALGSLEPDMVRARLREAPIYVSTALYEPFGLGVLEAAQAGCALVLSDIPTFRELWSGAAVFVDPRSAEAVATACNRLLADPDAAHRWGKQARRRARDFSVGAMAAGTAEVYARTLSAWAAGREAAA